MANTITENADQILGRAIDQLKANSQITRFTPGAKARTLLGILSSELERLEDTLTSSLVLGLVNGASGIYLDFLGELVGLQRTPRSAAGVSVVDQTIVVYVDDPLTFGDLNGGRPIIIPPGTVISSADGTIRYSTLTRLVLSPNGREQFVGASSLRFGAGGNVAKDVLTKINFESYETFPVTQLKVRNLSSIENGQEPDADSFYRHKITNALLAAETGNLTAVRLAALTVQSVADVIILPLFRGVGTADLILDTKDGTVSNVLLESVTRSVSFAKSLGMYILTRAPQLVGLEIALDVKYVRGVSIPDKQQINSNIRQSVMDLVATTHMGQTLNLNTISNAIMNSDKRIADIGAPGRPLSEVILWRDSLVTGSRRPVLVRDANLPLLIDERLILEGTPNVAIRVIEK